MIHALAPAAVLTAMLAVAMHCMHTVKRVALAGALARTWHATSPAAQGGVAGALCLGRASPLSLQAARAVPFRASEASLVIAIAGHPGSGPIPSAVRSGQMAARPIAGIRIAAISLVAGAAVVASAAPAVASTSPRTGHHGAPYAVGKRSYTFVDTSRPTSANGTYPGAPTRTLQTLLLYPAKGDPRRPGRSTTRPRWRRPRTSASRSSSSRTASAPAAPPTSRSCSSSCAGATSWPRRPSRSPTAPRPAVPGSWTTSTSPPT